LRPSLSENARGSMLLFASGKLRPPIRPPIRAVSSAVEHPVYTGKVAGSMPAPPTTLANFQHAEMSKTIVDPADSLIVSEVGPWAAEKHERLRRYISASRGARAKYLPPLNQGGAAFIELYSGPGRSVIRDTTNFIDGSPLVAFKAGRASSAPF